ncbi:MAG: hypothetical protein Kow0042_30570 [Calditrichia bacterium]
MPVSNEFVQLFLVFFLLLLAIFLFIYLSKRLRKGGGSTTTTMLGATYLFYDKEKRKAVEHIVKQKAGKKMKEQESEEGDARKSMPE